MAHITYISEIRNCLLPGATTVTYIDYRGPILDLTDEAQSRQEIEFLLPGATTESNMAAILNLEGN